MLINPVKSALGYTIAIIAIFILLAVSVGNDYITKTISSRIKLETSPWITGGKILQNIDHDDYVTNIHEPVFQGLISERKKGFIQIDWVKKQRFPDNIVETIDFDNDKKADFRIEYDSKNDRIKLMPIGPKVISLELKIKGRNSIIMRVLILK